MTKYENIVSEIKEKKAAELNKINEKIADLNKTIEGITSKRNELNNQLYDIEAKFDYEILAKCGENIDLLLNKWVSREDGTRRYFYINKIKKNFCRSENPDYYLFKTSGKLVSSISIEGRYFTLSNKISCYNGNQRDTISYGNFEKKFTTPREIFEFLKDLKEIKNSYTLKAFELMHSMLFEINKFKPIY